MTAYPWRTAVRTADTYEAVGESADAAAWRVVNAAPPSPHLGRFRSRDDLRCP
jgi:hypothetical protein